MSPFPQICIQNGISTPDHLAARPWMAPTVGRLLADMDTNPTNGAIRTEKVVRLYLSILSSRWLQLVATVLILALVDTDHRSLSPSKTKTEPSYTLNRNRLKYSTLQTNKTITRHPILRGNPCTPKWSKRSVKREADATQPVHW